MAYYVISSWVEYRANTPTFLAGGWVSSPFTGGGDVCSVSFSAAVRFLPRAVDLGFSSSPVSPSASAGLGFLERGLVGAFFDGGPGLTWSLMRDERRGSPASEEMEAPLRAMQNKVRGENCGLLVWGERRAGLV